MVDGFRIFIIGSKSLTDQNPLSSHLLSSTVELHGSLFNTCSSSFHFTSRHFCSNPQDGTSDTLWKVFLDRFDCAISIEGQAYVPDELRDDALSQKALICVDAYWVDGKTVQVGAVGRAYDGEGRVMFASSCVINVERLFPSCLAFAKKDQTLAEVIGLVYGTRCAMNFNLLQFDVATDSEICWGMLTRNVRNKFRSDTHKYLTMAAKELWRVSKGGLVAVISGQSNHVADFLSRRDLRDGSLSDSMCHGSIEFSKIVEQDRLDFQQFVSSSVAVSLKGVLPGKNYDHHVEKALVCFSQA